MNTRKPRKEVIVAFFLHGFLLSFVLFFDKSEIKSCAIHVTEKCLCIIHCYIKFDVKVKDLHFIQIEAVMPLGNTTLTC